VRPPCRNDVNEILGRLGSEDPAHSLAHGVEFALARIPGEQDAGLMVDPVAHEERPDGRLWARGIPTLGSARLNRDDLACYLYSLHPFSALFP
jgi:hypothetical protein